MFDRIDLVFATGLRNWVEVMDVNESEEIGPVYRLETEPADAAVGAVGGDAATASFRVTLVDRNQILGDGSFDEYVLRCQEWRR